MERIVNLSPAYDRRSKDPDKNYGIHGVELRMVVKGELGAVQFVVFTNWMLPHIYKEWETRSNPAEAWMYKPMAADAGYHSPKPTHTGQPKPTNSCEYLDGKPCYYDGSGLHAEKVFDILVSEGSNAVWEYLEQYYNEVFKPEESNA